MKKQVVAALVFAGAFWGGFALAEARRGPDYMSLLKRINAQLRYIAKKQEKVDLIIENQEKIIAKLNLLRRWN